MPILVVNLLEGRTDEQKREFAEEVTESVCKILGSTPEKVRIIFNEMPGNGYAIGGKLMQDIDPKFKKGSKND